MLTVSGEGMIYGGTVCVDANASQANSVVKMIIDDETQTSISFGVLNQYSLNQRMGSISHLAHYDDINFLYAVFLPVSVTFESMFEVVYYNAATTGQAVVAVTVSYALVA
jgi:hypothetical protein